MSFFHSTPLIKRRRRWKSPLESLSDSFFYDFKEWSEDQLELDTTTDFPEDDIEDWIMVDITGIPKPSELANQNDGKMTPGQRFQLIVRTVMDGIRISRIMQRHRLSKAVAEILESPIKRPQKKPLLSQINWSSNSSRSPFASLDLSSTM